MIERVNVNAGRGIDEIWQVRDDRNSRDAGEPSAQRGFVWRHDIRVHAVVEDLAVHGSRWPARRRGACRRLRDHITQEKIGVRIDVRRFEPIFKCRRAQRRRRIDGDRRRVNEARRRSGRVAVPRIADDRPRRLARDRDLERRGVKTAIDRKMGIAHETLNARAVRSTRRRHGHEAICESAACEHELRADEKIATSEAAVQTVNRQHVGTCREQAEMLSDVYVFI